MSREDEYLAKRVERLERELLEAREEIGRLKGPLFIDPAEQRKHEQRKRRTA